ncbi:MAG: hypothetical protein V3T83_21645 [Acidobacteriota bacterium]
MKNLTLAAGDRVVAKAKLKGVSIKAPTQSVTTGNLDWGRLRAYFSTGVILSKENEDFSEQDPFLGFNLDANWWKSKARNWSGQGSCSNQPDERDKLCAPRFMFNSFMDVRLTSIGVNKMEMPDEDDDGGGAMLRLQDDDEDEGTSVSDLLSSRSAALIQNGFYFPILTTVWKYNNHSNALFVAPLAKIGWQTTTENGMTVTPADQDGPMPMGVTGIMDDPAVMMPEDDVFNFYAFGVRMGHFDLKSMQGRNGDMTGASPQLLSYLDILFGKWENYEITEVINGETAVERPWRLALEGRLKIPRLPFYAGLEANLGQGRDDVRFFFGTTFDIGNLFGGLNFPK